MGRYKAKPIRLIDILGVMNDADMIVVMFKNQSQSTHSSYVRTIKSLLGDYLGCNIVGLIGGSVLTVMIDDVI